MVDSVYSGQTEFQPTDAIFLPLTRAWGAKGFDEAESKPEEGARVFRGMSYFKYCPP